MSAKSPPPVTVDQYISQFPASVQQVLIKIRSLVKEAAPGAVEGISYTMPAFFLNDPLIWFAAWKNHIALYPRTPEMDASIEGLSAYKGTKGSIHFPLDQPIPYDLIAKIIQFRLVESQKMRT